jgi:hypothetical protein
MFKNFFFLVTLSFIVLQAMVVQAHNAPFSLSDEDMAKKAGISAYATKPVSMTEIATLIREVL